MEASQKPQLPLDPAAEGTVRVIDGRLVIERLEVEDERAAQVVRERAEAGQPPAETITKSIEIGARVLEREGTAAEVDYVRAEFERNLGQLGERLTRQLDEGSESLAEQISRAFGAEHSDSVQQQIREILGEANEKQRAALAHLFSAEDGANPLTDFKGAVVRGLQELDARRQRDREADRKRVEELMGEVVRLRERLGAKEELEAERERGTAKGRSFEDAVFDAIEGIAAARGDAASHVGDEPGAGGSRKGDALVEIGAGDGAAVGRIVFEVKDSRLARPKAWAELNGALEARGAAFAVLVVAGPENVPPGQQELHEYEGNKLIVAVDPEDPTGRALELAYRYARCRVLLARESELTMDAAGVRDAAAEAMAALEDARGIRSALTTARNGVERARTGVDAMVEGVLERLERIESLVSGADG
jgi:hypothetical protein